MFWYLPFVNAHLDILTNNLGFDLFRYLNAAAGAAIFGTIHPELVNNPIPVIWCAFWLKFGLVYFVVAQATVFSALLSRLASLGRRQGIPAWVFLGIAMNPSILMYLGMPSKEFFIITGVLAILIIYLELMSNGAGKLEIGILSVFPIVAIIVRPAFVLIVLSLVIPKLRKKAWLFSIAAVSLCLLFFPKDYEMYGILNAELVSSNVLMQTFREFSVSQNPLIQIIWIFPRMIFYLLYPLPFLSVKGVLGSAPDFDTLFYLRIQAAESIGFLINIGLILWYLRFYYIRKPLAGKVYSDLTNFFLYSLFFLAIASPFPHARYRTASFLVWPFTAIAIGNYIIRKTQRRGGRRADC
jgi:hypothetical protein